MASPLDRIKVREINQLDAEQRYQYLLKEAVANQELWILTDEHGCVMLNTEDEDCVPVWPQEEFAKSWANDEWSDCKPQAISLKKWYSHWTLGLVDDDLSIVAFPNSDEEGFILDPEEFEDALRKQK